MLIKNLLAHKKLWLAAAVLWSLLIAIGCLVSFSNLPTVGLAGADKYVHIMLHFGFTVLWFGYMRLQFSKALFKTFLASVLYGSMIEIMQSAFTQTRQADFADILANAFGALLAVGMILLLKDRFAKLN